MLFGGSEKARRFDTLVAPHIGAAYNLARWLVRNDRDAEDVVQESCLRAVRFLDGFRGDSARSWLLTIVRNSSYTWLRQNRPQEVKVPPDGELRDNSLDPEVSLQNSIDAQILRNAMEQLPLEFREVIVLRELEEFSYREIAHMADIPIGTVMSRLARGRRMLRRLIGTISHRRSLHEL